MNLHKLSAGLLMYKFSQEKELKVFLVHPGGPFWKNKDKESWGISKGEVDDGETNLLEVAKREFFEETGITPPSDTSSYISLDQIKQKSGKIVHCWAFQGDFSGLLISHSYVSLEFPPKSGKFIKFSEVDKADFFTIEKAKEKINPAQYEFILRLKENPKI